MFLPTIKEECRKLTSDQLDVILVTGDTYIDSPFIGAAVIGQVLVDAGFSVGIIAQPDISGPHDICRLGEPRLFWGITGGCMDSMVSNYTALKKFRQKDDLTPGGFNTRRPDRAIIAYANLIRRYFKNTVPLVLGGIEASLRRIAHYDYWSDSIRNPVMFDAKADLLVYGMGEKAILEIAEHMKQKRDYRGISGICYIAKQPIDGYLSLPSCEMVKSDKQAFAEMFGLFYHSVSLPGRNGLVQQAGDRFLVHNPPADFETPEELDRIHSLPFEYDAHPYYKKQGIIRGLDTFRFSITTHRGCCGECHYCAIGLHQGKTIRSRSEESILAEAKRISQLPGFKGYITDAGGATANMYGLSCAAQEKAGSCADKKCLYPDVCKNIKFGHKKQITLLEKIEAIPGVKKVFIASGIRHDLVLADSVHGRNYLARLAARHTSGQLKIAPEHTEAVVCSIMGKPGAKALISFKQMFDRIQTETSAQQFLTYYFIAAHPGCTPGHMKTLREFIEKYLKVYPEQVQIFTPVPSTWSSLMYYTGKNPFTGEILFVEKNTREKEKQKAAIMKRK